MRAQPLSSVNSPIHLPLPIKIVDGKPMTKWDILAKDSPPRLPSEGSVPTPMRGLAEEFDYGVPRYVKRFSS